MNTKKFPVILSFDVDAETLWTSRDPANACKPVQLSMGAYGPTEGIPRILKVLDRYDIKANFFIPGLTAERYPDVVKRIDAGGHEIGNHTYDHTHPHKFTDKPEEKESLLKTAEILQRLTGKTPVAYRSPAWEFSTNTIDILEEIGIQWSSNMMNTDQVSFLKVFDRSTKIVEIPIAWMLDDAAYWLYSVSIAGKCMQPLEAVEDYWKKEFDGMYEEFINDDSRQNLCFTLTMHPQIIGRAARMKVLENVIRHIKSYPSVEFLTGIEVCKNFNAHII